MTKRPTRVVTQESRDGFGVLSTTYGEGDPSVSVSLDSAGATFTIPIFTRACGVPFRIGEWKLSGSDLTALIEDPSAFHIDIRRAP